MVFGNNRVHEATALRPLAGKRILINPLGSKPSLRGQNEENVLVSLVRSRSGIMTTCLPPELGTPSWFTADGHRRWLFAEEDRLMRFHESPVRSRSFGISPLDAAGAPDNQANRELYATARLVHCFSLEAMLGRPGAAARAGHAISVVNAFKDPDRPGWFSVFSAEGALVDDTKSAYAHAFVLLAAVSALQAGLSEAQALWTDAVSALDDLFWDQRAGAVVDTTTAEGQLVEPNYRGQNANMHLTEAYMAAFELTGDEKFQRRAESISDLIINRSGREWSWRVPEHFDQNWAVVPDFNSDKPDDPFRPFGSLVGHWFEWARLLVQLDALPGSRVPWATAAAKNLFSAGVTEGWDAAHGGVVYSVDFDGTPVNRSRMHWAIAEGIGASVYLGRLTGEPSYEAWYRMFWDQVAVDMIDLKGGSWWHEVDESGTPASTTWAGKPDLYHALQATLYLRADPRFGLAAAAHRGLIR